MRAWMFCGALAALATAGAGYYWFVLRTPEVGVLCEHIVKNTLAVPASYHRTGLQTSDASSGTITLLRFDALTRGGLPRSMVAECQMSKDKDTVWQLPDAIHVDVNGEVMPDDFVRTGAWEWARLRDDGKNLGPEVTYQRAMQTSAAVLKKKP